MSIARIGQNIMAMEAYRNLSCVQNNLGSNFRRFSTGLRIEGSKDDPSGLAISERFRSQITGYEAATKNAQDANNMVQVADGGLNETQAILQRLRHLALTSANGATTKADRANMQTEVNQLLDELDNISRTTQYNGRTLLDGSLSGSKSRVGSKVELIQNPYVNVSSSQGTTPRALITDIVFNKTPGGAIANPTPVDTYNGPDVTLEFTLIKRKNLSLTSPNYGNDGIFVQLRKSDVYNFATGELSELILTGTDSHNDLTQTNVWNSWRITNSVYIANNCRLQFLIPPISIDEADIGKTAIIKVTSEQKAVTVDKSLSFQIGANQGQVVNISMDDMSTSGLGLKKLDVMSHLAGQNALGKIDDALKKVSTQRANLGAVQQRISSKLNSNELTTINQRSAESRIRDMDFAEETLSFTRNQILTKSGTSVLAQANTSSRVVFPLLGVT